MKPLIAIVGPTASGKTELAIQLAKKYGGGIVCADSRTIYKRLDIGTAKPGIRKKIPHYLIDLIEPNKNFTVAQFQKMAYQVIDDILARGKIPFLVGGTGLYIDAVIKGLSIPEVPPNSALRARLEKMSNKKLASELEKLDVTSTTKINPKNKRRLIRALEVCLTTGKPFSELQKIKKPPYKVLTLGIVLPREKLYENIDKRVDKMIEIGFVEEVKGLLGKGYSLDLSSMSAIGYKQIGEWLVSDKSRPFKKVVEEIKQATRHFACRQLTWFRHDQSIIWVKDQKEAEEKIREFLKKKKDP